MLQIIGWMLCFLIIMIGIIIIVFGENKPLRMFGLVPIIMGMVFYVLINNQANEYNRSMESVIDGHNGPEDMNLTLE
jgi:cadmium resistance protein CadD (predicted permease)